MNIHTLSENAFFAASIKPQAISAETSGSAINVDGYENLLCVVSFGAVASGSAISLTVKLQSGDASNGSDAEDITGATTGTITNTNQNKCKLIDVNLSEINKKFVRAVATPGADGGGVAEVLFILYNGRRMPPTQLLTAVNV